MRNLLALLLLAPCALLAQVPDYVPTDGLVAWYPMNGNALDESGNGYDCQSIGATLTEDRFGAPSSAYAFDGQGSHLQGGSLPFSDLSISLWFKAEAGVFETYSGGSPPTGAQLIGQGTTHNPCRYCDWAIGISDWIDGVDNLAWEKANSSSCQVQQTATNWEPELEEWTHLVAVSEGADVSFYINNDWVSTIPFDQPFQQGGSILSIGSRYVENCNGGGSCTGPDNAWSGSIDDVAVWNRALTPAEITSLYQGQAEPPMMGCTDSTACNYDPAATEDEGSCLYPITILNVGDTVVTTEPLILESSGTQCSWSTGAETCSTLVTESGWYTVTQLDATSEGLRINPGQQVSLGGEDDFNFGTGDFSIALWFRSSDSITDYSTQLDPNGQFQILSKSPPPPFPYNNYYYDIQAGISQHSIYGTTYQTGPGTKFHWNSEPHPGSFNAYTDQVVCDGSWHHLTAVKEGTTLKMAIDGSFVHSAQDRTPNPGQTADNIGPLYLGVTDSAYAPMPYFIGQVQIFNEALTETELESLMTDPIDTSASGLLGAWEFRGADAGPSDLSGEGNHAELSGASLAYSAAGCSSSDSVYVHFIVTGCTDSTACNYNPTAPEDDGSCDYSCCPGPGCCSDGTVWDTELHQCVTQSSPCDTVYLSVPSCGPGTVWDPINEMCIVAIPADLNFDGCVTVGDLLELLAVHGTCPPYPEWPDFPGDTSTTGWSCGDPLPYQGYDYATVQIGDQCWFAESLRSMQSLDGADLEAGNPGNWPDFQDGTGAWMHPDNDPALLPYGLLYNWHATAQGGGMCPSEWHLPSDEEWKELENQLGIDAAELDSFGWHGTMQGAELKSSTEWNGTNTQGFEAVPSGGVHANQGHASSFGSDVWFWTSSTLPTDSGKAIFRSLSSGESRINRQHTFKNHGASIRCLKD